MPSKSIGRIIPKFKGEWSSKETYAVLDVVFHDGSSYVAIADNTFTEVTDTTKWQIIAKSGEFVVSDNDLATAVQDKIKEMRTMNVDILQIMGTSPRIEFHYNSADKPTSTITESKRGLLTVGGDVEVTGEVSSPTINRIIKRIEQLEKK